MTQPLETIRAHWNPNNRLPLNAVEVAARGIHSPQIDGQVFTGTDGVVIEGDVRLAKGAVVQRQTHLIAEPGHHVTIGRAAPVMDYVRITAKHADVSIGDHVTIAHGSHLTAKGPITFANESFGNINMRVTGGTVNRDGYLGPGTDFGPGEEVPEGAVFFGNPLFDDGKRTVAGEITSGTKTISRRNIGNTSPELHDKEGTLTLENYPGYTRWSAALDAHADALRTRQADYPFEQWLRKYSLRQVAKAAAHMAGQERSEGRVVWDHVAVQSDSLQLKTVAAILTANGNRELAGDVTNLLKANAYLLRAYEPKDPSELNALNKAYGDAGNILAQAATVLQSLPTIAIKTASRENIISAATGDLLPGATHEVATLDKAALDRRVSRLAAIAARITSLHGMAIEESAGIPLYSGAEVAQMQAIRGSLNKTGANIAQLPDGPTIRSYDGAIPIIHPEAVLVGKVDVVGNVRIGNAAISDASLRTEMPVVPVVVGDDAVVKHAIVHTAGREQTPVEVGNGTLVDGAKDAKAVLHGPYLGEGSYVGPRAVVVDEVLTRGIVLPNTVLAGVVKGTEWHVYGGNIASAPLTAREIAKDTGYAQLPASLQDPDILRNPERAGAAITVLRDQARQGIIREQQAKIETYGEIYAQSAAMQVELLSLRATARLIGDSNPSLVRQLGELGESYSFLLGETSSISANASRLFLNQRAREEVIERAKTSLQAIPEEGISVPLWKDERRREATHAVIEATLHPSFTDAEQKRKLVDDKLPVTDHYRSSEIALRIIPNLDRVKARSLTLTPASELAAIPDAARANGRRPSYTQLVVAVPGRTAVASVA